jgi:hypothetical protein
MGPTNITTTLHSYAGWIEQKAEKDAMAVPSQKRLWSDG